MDSQTRGIRIAIDVSYSHISHITSPKHNVGGPGNQNLLDQYFNFAQVMPNG
jgi:hypothetical protein